MSREEIIAKSRALPRVYDFFNGKRLPENFRVPGDILLYCHDFPWPRTIISTRYMLIIPFSTITYRIEDETYSAGVGDAILVKPYLHRSVPTLHHDYLRLIISFELEGEQDYLPGAALSKLSDNGWKLLDALLTTYADGDAVTCAFQLVSLLRDLGQNSREESERKLCEKVMLVSTLVNQYLGQTLSIKDLAAKVDWSPSHLRRSFRIQTGMSLGEYIERRRLASAQRLLSDTEMSVAAVAEACGYESIYSFSRFFKNRTGIPPLRFRRECRSGQP